MKGKENNSLGRRLANAYLSSVISISLVLLLVGLASLLLVNAKTISDYFKENMKISVLMKQEVAEDEARTYMDGLAAEAFVNSLSLISREQGIEEMKELLGEDFLDVFETAPIPVSIELTLKADYVAADSLDFIRVGLEESELVSEVVYQRAVVERLNANLGRISLLLGIGVILLLFISYVLINNTVRLSIYARRFTIHTMTLVGATRRFIRAPFVADAVFLGLIAALVSTLMLTGFLFLLKAEFAQLFSVFGLKMMLMTIAIVVAGGVLICVMSTCFAVNRLVSLRKGELYY